MYLFFCPVKSVIFRRFTDIYREIIHVFFPVKKMLFYCFAVILLYTGCQ